MEVPGTHELAKRPVAGGEATSNTDTTDPARWSKATETRGAKEGWRARCNIYAHSAGASRPRCRALGGPHWDRRRPPRSFHGASSGWNGCRGRLRRRSASPVVAPLPASSFLHVDRAWDGGGRVQGGQEGRPGVGGASPRERDAQIRRPPELVPHPRQKDVVGVEDPSPRPPSFRPPPPPPLFYPSFRPVLAPTG